ncbi:hypothetical protein TKK_0014419 [Trichogramma kaykai]|uniref:CLIP domain-containing serine protease n=1 Tax=Trichogramma kaykai TaxID=54128 RepID=A0ABD2WDM9_9HYME
MKCVVYLAVALFLAQESLAQFSCLTPDSRIGSCINIYQCPALLALLQQRPLLPASVQFLQKAQCGFEGKNPKVCCEPSSNGNGGNNGNVWGQQTTTTTTTTTTRRPILPPNNGGNNAGSGSNPSPPDVTRHPNLRLLDHNLCGPISDDKIYGGNRTKVNEFPWMALVAYDTGLSEPQYRCGGSIINKRYILTAAHCVRNLGFNLRPVGIRVGEHDLGSERDCDYAGTPNEVCAEKYQDFGIERIIAHQKYNPVSLQNDIALIRLSRDIDFRPDNAKPICMPVAPANKINSNKLLVTGWGLTEQRQVSPVMLKVSLPIFSQERCAERYKGQTIVWYKQICVGGEQGKDSCSGDSGGPLQGVGVYNGEPRYVQHGLVSFGLRNCGQSGFPGVYTRLEYYLDWVLDNIKD